MSTNILVTLGLSGAEKDKRKQKTQEEKISNWYWVDSKKVEKRNIYRNENGEGKGGKEGQPALVKNDRQSPEQTSEWDAVGQQQPRDQCLNQRDLFSSSSLGFWKRSWRKVRRKKENPAKEYKPDHRLLGLWPGRAAVAEMTACSDWRNTVHRCGYVATVYKCFKGKFEWTVEEIGWIWKVKWYQGESYFFTMERWR